MSAIYHSFGYNHFPDFQRNFIPEVKIKSWFHSEEQLEYVFSRALKGATAVARERGF
jgi:hypothetical protein